MKEMIKKFYEEYTTIEKAYDAATTDEAKEAAREMYREWKERASANGDEFCKVYRMYADAMKRGNELIDIHDVVWDKDAPALIESLRNAGFNKFTFSAGWSSAVETAWIFIQNGCKLEGMAEINGTTTAFKSEEYERVPAYVFAIN